MTERREVIELPGEVHRILAEKAAERGLDLKDYIRGLLIEEAYELEEGEIYGLVAASRPEGRVILNEIETTEFENWLEGNRI